MNVFEAVKQFVTTREVAEMYGVKVQRNGMACCPFHDDRSPSMKLDKRFHCFGCGADGDAVDFVARLYELPVRDAAMKIADDFGIPYERYGKPSIKPKIREPTERELLQREQKHAEQVLGKYLSLLRNWEKSYAPLSPSDEWNDLFVEALHKKEYVGYLMDLLFDCPKENMKALLAELGEEVRKIERRITEYERGREHQKRSRCGTER